MKKMSRDTKRFLVIAAVVAVIAVIYFASAGPGPEAPAEPQITDAPQPALSTLPPTEAPTAETQPPASAAPVAETEPPAEPVYEYPEDISYTGGESDGIDETGTYSGAEDVAYYLHTYGHLPDNYITKAEAEDAGWVSTKGNLWDVAYGSSIGGDRFGNREGLLPKGEQYYECDVNYIGGYRGEERLIFTDDGDVYYTCDHYKSFEKLY